MGTVALVLHAPARKDGKLPVCVRVGKDRKYAYETICYVKGTHWNPSAGQVLTYDPDHGAMNTAIRHRLRQVGELVQTFDDRGWRYVARDILDVDYEAWVAQQAEAEQQAALAEPSGFVNYVHTVIVPYWQSRNNLYNADRYAFEADLLSEFLLTRKPAKADVSMDRIDTALVEAYFTYLRTKPKTPCKKDSTLKQRLAQLIAVLNFAHTKGAIAKVPQFEVTLDVQKAKKLKLAKEQIDTLEAYEWPTEVIVPLRGSLHRLKKGIATEKLAVRTFLFQYYLYGARISDVLLLRNRNVISRGGRPVRIEYYQKKGKKQSGKRLMEIDVNPSLGRLLVDYWQPDQPNSYLLPWLSWERDVTRSDAENALLLTEDIKRKTSLMNGALKNACVRMGLDAEPFSSHSARHSYAQRAKRKGKSIEWIKETLGHSNYDITATYLSDLDTEELNQNMRDVYD